MRRFRGLPASMLKRRSGALNGTTRVVVLGAFLTTASVWSFTPSHLRLLLNTTPSEPLGLYVQVNAPPDAGRIIAFRTPSGAFPYADRRLSYLHRVPLLKAVAARRGDKVCTRSGRLVINGLDRAPIAVADREGKALPRWLGCRALGSDELFVFSDRVPNSFDSRYFGPVPSSLVLGVFRPVFGLTGRR